MEDDTGAPVVRALAEFASGLDMERLPPEVVEKARCCLLYGLGIGTCAFSTRFAPMAAHAAQALHPAGSGAGATILYSGGQSSLTAALLANVALLHARCQEDTSGTAHLGVVTIPLLLGLMEMRGLPAERLLPALIAGYEVGGHMEDAMARRSLAAGFRASPLYGVFAATAAASRLLALSPGATAHALSHAAAFAGGTLQAIGEGSDEWRYQVGVAANAGLTAAVLAEAGAEGAERSFEGQQGFAAAFTRQSFPAGVVEKLGRDWSILRTTFKPYPVCAHNQTVITAALGLRDQLAGQDVAAIEVRIDPYIVPGMTFQGPFRRVSETLMSTSFVAAATLVRGRLDIAELEAFDDPAIIRLVPRITLVTDPAIVFPACSVEARLTSGERLVQAEPATAADYDLNRSQVLAQLRRMAALVGVPERAIALLADHADAPELGVAPVLEAFAEVRAARDAAAQDRSVAA